MDIEIESKEATAACPICSVVNHFEGDPIIIAKQRIEKSKYIGDKCRIVTYRTIYRKYTCTNCGTHYSHEDYLEDIDSEECD